MGAIALPLSLATLVAIFFLALQPAWSLTQQGELSADSMPNRMPWQRDSDWAPEYEKYVNDLPGLVRAQRRPGELADSGAAPSAWRSGSRIYLRRGVDWRG